VTSSVDNRCGRSRGGGGWWCACGFVVVDDECPFGGSASWCRAAERAFVAAHVPVAVGGDPTP